MSGVRLMRIPIALLGLVLLSACSGGAPQGSSEPGSQAVSGSSVPSTMHPSAAPSAGKTVRLSGYELAQDPQAAIDFSGNALIFEGRIIGKPAPAVKVPENPDTGSPMLVYLPVPLQITAVYKGSVNVGDRVYLRDLGGTSSDGSTLVYEGGYADSTWKAGIDVFVYSNPSVQPPGDPLAALTPNMLFVEENGVAHSAARAGEPTMPIAEMRKAVKARWQ